MEVSYTPHPPNDAPTPMQQIVAFILELDKLKSVTRKVRPLGLDRYENSAEHSWQIAMMAVALEAYAESPVDINHVIRMLLVHDIGEIDTGDTMVFVEGGWKERKAAELAAVTRIFRLLPAPQADALLALWQEFEQGDTAEARFAHSVDRAMPALLNLNNNGQSWREHGISYERVVGRIGPEIAAGCPALWKYMEARLQDARHNGWFGIPNAE
jgi:putative hydrolase of HD superfamily